MAVQSGNLQLDLITPCKLLLETWSLTYSDISLSTPTHSHSTPNPTPQHHTQNTTEENSGEEALSDFPKFPRASPLHFQPMASPSPAQPSLTFSCKTLIRGWTRTKLLGRKNRRTKVMKKKIQHIRGAEKPPEMFMHRAWILLLSPKLALSSKHFQGLFCAS